MTTHIPYLQKKRGLSLKRKKVDCGHTEQIENGGLHKENKLSDVACADNSMGITKTSNFLGQISDEIEITGTSICGQRKPEIVTDQDLSNILTPGYWLNDLVICYAQTIN